MLLQSHRSRDVSTTIQDMGIKGFAYQAHQRQSQSQVILGVRATNSVVLPFGQVMLLF